jgi:hypothetical protein
VLPLQQPLGHELASQVQAAELLAHSWLVPHAPHAAPPVPQELFVCDAYRTHVLPSQHPFGHEPALHTHCPVPLHAWLVAHVVHVVPAGPHDVGVSLANVSQIPALQQPAHGAPPHEHDPPTQAPASAQAPQATPPAPHESPFWAA